MQGIRPNYNRGGYFRGNRGNSHFRNSHHEPSAERNENSIKQFWCETCDRDFKSSHLLDQHKQQHQTCNIDGCKFVAHPKVITKHIQMQHSSGLFNKISKLNNPDEINKWREERKKRYPTKQNIELKIAQAKEKFHRGEKLGQNDQTKKPHQKDVKRNNKRRARPPKTPKLQNDNINVTPKNNEKKQPTVPKAIPEVKVCTKLKPFAGIQELNIDSDEDEEVENNLLIEDDEIVMDAVIESGPKNEAVVCGALSNLINDYGSSDESEAVETTTVKEPAPNCFIPKPIQTSSNVTDIKHDKSDSDSGPDEVTITKDADICNIKETDVSSIKAPDKPKLKRPHNTRNDRSQPPKRYKPKPQSTLLTKLLAKEIRQERNMVLQCVRHIVRNNYFKNK